MRIISRRSLTRFAESRQGRPDHTALDAALRAWFAEVKRARWKGPADIKRMYRSASIVSGECVVFNIRGNAYRLVVAVDFEKGIVWIKWVGTHADHDRIDVRTVSHVRS